MIICGPELVVLLWSCLGNSRSFCGIKRSFLEISGPFVVLSGPCLDISGPCMVLSGPFCTTNHKANLINQNLNTSKCELLDFAIVDLSRGSRGGHRARELGAAPQPMMRPRGPPGAPLQPQHTSARPNTQPQCCCNSHAAYGRARMLVGMS